MTDQAIEPFDLAGYRVEKWYQVTGGFGTSQYFGELPLAEQEVSRRAQSNQRFWINPVTVLTKDGKTGFILHPEQTAEINKT